MFQAESDRVWAELLARREAIRTRVRIDVFFFKWFQRFSSLFVQILEEERLRQEAEEAALREQQAREQAAADAAAAAKKGKGSPKGKKKK